MNTIVKRFALAFLCVSLFAVAAQAETGATKTIGRGAYALTISSDFSPVGNTSVAVPLNSEVSGSIPRGTVSSKVFTSGDTVLFVQRIATPAANNYLRPLGGSKVVKWGKDWRENVFSVSAADTTREFSQYLTFLNERGLSVASNYTVKMYDQIVSPSSIARVLVFTPANADNLPAAPSAAALYTLAENK